ncbi:hypothetical protein [Actinoplanes rectilineatus]|uniref:hypothetical protein n=1 Tax=Actinoplanes rectilineatus TaxID=113571 RepID=UPI0005F2DDD9|nr:hypothetical protein [Actinoplanes rectilineatus]
MMKRRRRLAVAAAMIPFSLMPAGCGRTAAAPEAVPPASTAASTAPAWGGDLVLPVGPIGTGIQPEADDRTRRDESRTRYAEDAVGTEMVPEPDSTLLPEQPVDIDPSDEPLPETAPPDENPAEGPDEIPEEVPEEIPEEAEELPEPVVTE